MMPPFPGADSDRSGIEHHSYVLLNVSGSRLSSRPSSTDATAHSPLFTAYYVVAHCLDTSPDPFEPTIA